MEQKLNNSLITKIINKYIGQKNNPLNGLTFLEIQELAEKENLDNETIV